MYTLSTENLPILSTLKGWKHGFESPFKAEVYFVSMRRFTDLKWGTKNPIMMRDVEFGPVRLRAFGTYAIRVNDPAIFIKEIVGTDGHFTTSEITNQLRNMIITRFTDLLGESKIPVLDLASNYNELSDFASGKIAPEFGSYGLEVTKLLVENISLPPAVEEAMDKRSAMGVIGNLNAYTQLQSANAMEDLANNPGAGGGMAGGGMGMGMGFAMANQMGQSINQQNQSPPAQQQQTPPPLSAQQETYFLAINGQQTGPFPLSELGPKVADGQLTIETLVWKQGMAQWTEAGKVPALANIFNQGPPPLPG